MTVYATAADVQDAYERDIPSEAYVTVQINKVERFLARKVPDLADRLAAGTCTLEDVRLVVVEATMRILRNPAGVRSEVAGEFSYNRDAGSVGTTGQVAFTAEELALLGSKGRRIAPITSSVPCWRVP